MLSLKRIKDFATHHKIILMMLAPLVFGLSFFGFSVIAGLFTISQTQLPSDFKNIKIELAKYEIKQIDPNTNQIKWILRANKSQANTDESKARVIDPQLVYYQGSKPGFFIKSKIAYLNSQKQEVQMSGDVKLVSADNRYTVEAGVLLFSDSRDDILVDQRWKLNLDEGYMISGNSGQISRDFQHVVSNGSAKLLKEDPKDPVNLSAGQITVISKDSKTTVEAKQGAVLLMSPGRTLKGNSILINNDGTVLAKSQVGIFSEKLSCHSELMKIFVDSNKKPEKAVFDQHPYAIQNSKKIFADRIIYDFATEQLTLEGKVHSEPI